MAALAFAGLEHWAPVWRAPCRVSNGVAARPRRMAAVHIETAVALDRVVRRQRPAATLTGALDRKPRPVASMFVVTRHGVRRRRACHAQVLDDSVAAAVSGYRGVPGRAAASFADMIHGSPCSALSIWSSGVLTACPSTTNRHSSRHPR